MADSGSVSSSSLDSASVATADQVQNAARGRGQALSSESSRSWRDIFWSIVFIIHLIIVGFVLVILGLNRFKKSNRLQIDKFTNTIMENRVGLTEDYWPLFALAGGVGTLLGWTWLFLLGSFANHVMKISVHILTTYLAVISVLCFWGQLFFWGVAFASGAGLQFLYVISVIDRLPFTLLVLQKAVTMVSGLPEVIRVAYTFMIVMLLCMGVWSFGVAGIVASSMGDGGRWWLIVVFSISLFWVGAVFCNTLHVIVSGMVFLVLFHGGGESSSLPSKSLVRASRYAVTTSFGSICYGSLFTAAIRTLRWEIRGIRSKIGKNECLLCCVDFLFHLVETLVRFFNKYAYVQIAVYGKSFNRSARDAWELFQSTGVETLVAYDCSGAVLLMSTIMGGLIAGTCSGIWTWFKWKDKVSMVACTATLMGMVMAGLAIVVVESAVTSIYICYAEDPLLIHRWDIEFFDQMSEMLHQRLQHRSARAREVLTQYRFDSRREELAQWAMISLLILSTPFGCSFAPPLPPPPPPPPPSFSANFSHPHMAAPVDYPRNPCEPQPHSTVAWSSGLCDCCNDVSICCLTCWCPCITFGHIAEIVDRGSISCGVSSAIYLSILCLTGCSCLYSCLYRSKMRGQFSLEESPCCDCCVHCLCEQCALCQQYRELQHQGFDMSFGWHGNVERQRRIAARAAATPPPPSVQGMIR